jgi:radical SAM superfamily enzyme YgiQ (UPF0313 family)
MAKKRVALISSKVEPVNMLPINLLILAGFVEDICDVLVFDPEYDDHKLRNITDFQPDIVGVTSMTQTFPRAKEIISILRRELKGGTQFIMGGIHPTVVPGQVLDEADVDAIIVGEGEYSFKEFIKGKGYKDILGLHYHGGANPRRPLIENLDSIPLPAYHKLIDLEKFFIPPGTIKGKWEKRGTINIMTGRGCPNKCIFCCTNLMFGRKLRRRSVDNVIREIKLVLDTYGKTSFWISDDTFTYQKKWVLDFCEKIKPFNVHWQVAARPDTISDDIVKAMKNSGCVQVMMGIESGSDKVLKILQKGETREQYFRAFEILKKNKLRYSCSFIIGTPGETKEDVMLTKSLIQIGKPSFTTVFYMTPFPGTAVYKIVEENNLWVDKEKKVVGLHDTPIIQDKCSVEEQIRLRKDLIRISNWKNIVGFLSIDAILAFFSSLSIEAVTLFFKTLVKKRNIYDAMYALRTFIISSYNRKYLKNKR